MRPVASISWLLFVLIVGALGGCSGSEPATAPPAPVNPGLAQLPGPDPSLALFGAWMLSIGPDGASAELAPLRTGAATFGDSFWINATGYLDQIPCGDCLRVRGIRRDVEGKTILRVQARHPFAPGDPSLPISGTNRLDLHVFDAELMLAGDLANASATPLGAEVTVPARLLVNADGYSDAFAGVAQTLNPALEATALPYVAIGPDPAPGNYDPVNPGGFADLQNPFGHNVFAMGADTETTLVLDLREGESVTVPVFFIASYGISAPTRSDRLTPRYALPEYNAKAAWRVVVSIPDPTNGLMAGDPLSTAQINVTVWDWQAAAVVNPNLDALDEIRDPSAPGIVALAVPGLLSLPLDLGAPVGGTGPYDDPLAYTATLANELAAPEGDYFALAVVEDTRVAGLNAGGQPDGLSNQNGESLDPVTISRFRTYQIATVTVGGGKQNFSTLDILPNTRQIIEQGVGNEITFTAIADQGLPSETDVTTQVTWDSSALDVAEFAGDNLLEGIGMGLTAITATLDALTSSPTAVIVKPVELTSITTISPQEVDVNNLTGEVFASVALPNGIEVYDLDGGFLRRWDIPESHMDTVNGTRVDAITVDEATGEVYVGASWYRPTNNNCVVYDAQGNFQRGMNIEVFTLPPFMNSGVLGLSMLDNGQLWNDDFLGPGQTVGYFMRYDPQTGATIDSIHGGCQTSDPAELCHFAPIGMDDKDNLLYVATVGRRFAPANKAVSVVDPATKTTLAQYSQQPAGTNQNDSIAVDRDGLIHVAWNGESPGTLVMHVYEYIPGDGIYLLYDYAPANTAESFGNGMAVARVPNRVILAHSVFSASNTGRLTYFD